MLSLNRKKILSKVVYHNGFFSKGTGLMFHKRIKDEAHVFVFKKPKKVGITMMFVFFSIDIVFLDSSKKIVEMKERLKPFSEYFPKIKSNFVIEMPDGTLRKNMLKLGDKLSL